MILNHVRNHVRIAVSVSMARDEVRVPPCSSRSSDAERGADATAGAAGRSACAAALADDPAEMDARGWDGVDVVFVTGDAYVDHPSFAMALLGRVLEAEGFRVAILSQPDWRIVRGLAAVRPAAAVLRHQRRQHGLDDQPLHGQPEGPQRRRLQPRRPDRPAARPGDAGLLPAAREAYPGVPVIAGGVEAILRRLAHYDYWSDKVRRSILLDSKADLLVYGMGEQPIVEIAQRLAAGESVARPARHARRGLSRSGASETPAGRGALVASQLRGGARPTSGRSPQVTRIIHHETNPHNARPLVQYHDREAVVVQSAGPAAQPGRRWTASTACPSRAGRTRATRASRSRPSRWSRTRSDHARLLRRLHVLLDHGPRGPDHPAAVAGVGPGRNPHDGRRTRSSRAWSATSAARRPTCTRCAARGPRSRRSAAGCPACIPTICKLLGTDHGPLVELMRKSREVPGVKKVLVASRHPHGPGPPSPEYMRELAPHHVGGHLKVAPEHTDPNVLRPDEEARRRRLRGVRRGVPARPVEKAGKKQYLVPYFIASHPGSDLDAMIDLALFLKRNGYQPDQVQDFIPAPFDIATCMYYTGIDPFTGEAGLRRQAPARPQAAAGAAAVLQAGELLRGPRGAAQGRPPRPDRQRLRLPDPGPAAEGGDRGATAAGERGGQWRPLPHGGQPGEGRAGRRARPAESGLPTGAEDGTSSGQEASTERRRWLTALTNALGSFVR